MLASQGFFGRRRWTPLKRRPYLLGTIVFGYRLVAIVAPYLQKLGPEQRAILEDPARYAGAAQARTLAVCDEWERKLVEVAEGV